MFKAGERPTVIRIWNTPLTHLTMTMTMTVKKRMTMIVDSVVKIKI